MYPTQIGRRVCQCICRSGRKWWNEMGVQLFFEGTATHLIIELRQILVAIGQIFLKTCTCVLLQKVVTDYPGDFLWGLFVDSEIVQFWKCLRFRSR